MSIKNIYSEMISFDSLLKAEKDSRAGRRYEKEQITFWGDLESNLHEMSDRLINHDYPPDIYNYFYVYVPKLRKVIYSDYVTKIIHRATYNMLNPLVSQGFIEDTYSCIKGRGQLAAMKRLSGWIDYAQRSGERWYYLKMDVEKFFYRIDHEVMMQIVRKKICDKDMVKFLDHYICHASRAFGLPLGVRNPMSIPDEDMLWNVGIAIGGGLSHMLGNMYLDPMDQLAKRDMRLHYYIRFMDDSLALSPDKGELQRDLRRFEEFLGDVLHLRLNSKTCIRPIDQGVEYVGYMIRPGNVRLRKSTSLRMKHSLSKIQEMYRDNEISLDKARETLMSYKAMMENCDCQALEQKIFDEFVLTHNPKEVVQNDGS